MNIAALALPLRLQKTPSIILKRLVFTDELDDSRLVCIFHSIPNSEDLVECTSLSRIHNKTSNVSPELVSYVQHPSYEAKDPQTPLLVVASPYQNKIKLTVSINREYYSNNSEKKALVISKSAAGDDSIKTLKQSLDQASFISGARELSKLAFSSLPIDNGTDQWSQIVINDTFNPNNYHENRLNIFLWEMDVDLGIHTPILDLKIWIGGEIVAPILPPEPPRNTQEESVMMPVNRLKDALSFKSEDGPEFRQSLAFFEKNWPLYKTSMEGIIDNIKQVEKLAERLSSTKHKILEQFKIVIKFNAFEPLLTELNFVKEFSSALDSLFDPFIHKVHIVSKFVLDIKTSSKLLHQLNMLASDEKGNAQSVDSNKKLFDNNSKEYYSWLNKYLSNEKERPELKFFTKRKAFEESKLEYLTFLYNSTNSQYHTLIQENLFKLIYVNKQSKLWRTVSAGWKTIQPEQKYLSYLKLVSQYNSSRLLLRQRLLASHTLEELTDILKSTNMSSDVFGENGSTDAVDFNDASVENLLPGPRKRLPSGSGPVDDFKDQNSEMEGILNTLGGKGKQGWHKEWVVLSNGQLREFSDWRKGTSPINKPIEIALSSVRSIVKDKRKFCFEITSLDAKHVFQAVSEKERDDWIKALYNAGQHVDTERIKASSSISKKKNTPSNLLKQPPIKTKFVNVQSDSVSPVSITASMPLSTVDYLKQLRENSEETKNNICADCGSSEAVEWISLNFLTIFCLKCSGVHRSLGSNISRIRSLKLDNFKGEQEILIKYANNARANLYLEYHASKGNRKITPSATDEQRTEFIRSKYLKLQYCEKTEQDVLDNKIIASVQTINIPDTVKYTSLQADINMQLTMNLGGETVKMSLIEYSLRKYVEVAEEDSRKYFVVTEILVLNGAKVAGINNLRDEIGVVAEAKKYWTDRVNKLLGA